MIFSEKSTKTEPQKAMYHGMAAKTATEMDTITKRRKSGKTLMFA